MKTSLKYFESSQNTVYSNLSDFLIIQEEVKSTMLFDGYVIGGNKVLFALLDYVFMPLFILIILIFIAYIIQNWFPLIWKVLTGDRAKVINTKKE